jgi:predicted ester cyclase
MTYTQNIHMATNERRLAVSKGQENKTIVTRWFEQYWGKTGNVAIVDELGTPDVLVDYPMHGPRRGREAVKKMMTEFRAAFPDLNLWPVGKLIAEGDYVVGRWVGGGTHTSPASSDLPVGSLPVTSGKKIRFTVTPVFRHQGWQDRGRNRRGRRVNRAAAARPGPREVTLARPARSCDVHGD